MDVAGNLGPNARRSEGFLRMSLTMSAIGTKRTSLVAPHMSAFGGKADMAIALAFQQIARIPLSSSWAFLLTFYSWCYSCISEILPDTTSFVSVAATTCSTETPGPVSSKVARPSGNAITAISLNKIDWSY